MVPLGSDIEELEDGPDSEWGRLELSDTHFDLELDDELDPHEEIQQIVDDLWEHAIARTRESRSWCDFQLVGFGDGDRVLFADGRRCQVGSSQQPSQRSGHDPSEPDLEAIERAFEKLDARKDKFIERLASDRDWSFATAQQAMTAAPALFDRAGEILKDTIAYQQDVVRQLTNRANGQVEFRSRAFEEMERTRRFRLGAEMLAGGVESLASTLIPFADKALELLLNHRVMVFPQFTSAQMAMSYLVESLRPSALLRMLDNNRQAVGECRALLVAASRMPNERDALYEIADLMDLFRSERFEQNAAPEEQLAARYIIGALRHLQDGRHWRSDRGLRAGASACTRRARGAIPSGP